MGKVRPGDPYIAGVRVGIGFNSLRCSADVIECWSHNLSLFILDKLLRVFHL